MSIFTKFSVTFLGLALALTTTVAEAHHRPNHTQGGSTDSGSTDDSTPETGPQPPYYTWMSPEIKDAWLGGFTGQGTVVTSIDDFTSGSFFKGNMGDGEQSLRHGEWVDKQIGMIAPDAARAQHDFSSSSQVRLARNKLNTLNLSYGMIGSASQSTLTVNWSARETSIIEYAHGGKAVVVKAAGNDAVAVGEPAGTRFDFLNRDLIGAQSAIFVGALDRNGTTDTQAKLTGYSNYAGSNTTVQNQFLSVGVRGDLTGLRGTSFAAPIVSGYAAVLGSKFDKASPTSIANQLLSTARQDTIQGYNAALHGRGEASIKNALAPSSIK